LRVEHVERIDGMIACYGLDDCVDIALEIAAILFAQRFEADDAHAPNRWRGAAAIYARARGIAIILADHRHVVARRDKLAQQVDRVDRHPRYRGEEAARDEADSHQLSAARR
jgi:hypothetical protein